MNIDFLKEFSDSTEIAKYLTQIKKTIEENKEGLFKEKYFPIIEQNNKRETCFLSVIIRTQGKREDGLREALLCLQAQSCQDFEIILIGHKLEDSHAKVVNEILEDQSLEFRQKIRYYELNEGGRATPLNFGFAHSHGRYAAIFDDDDILFANWVESFKKCSENNEGRILHAYAFSQNWKNVEDRGYRAESAPLSNYCLDFNLINQLVINRCPLMTLAFPVKMFQQLGMTFNEKLNVTEDWEYFMRMAFLCGVSDIRAATAIYRFWENIETSATLHKQEDWDETYHAIQDGFDKNSIILPAGNIRPIIGMLSGKNNSLTNENGNPNFSRLYFSDGKPFDDINCIVACNDQTLPKFDVWFIFEEKHDDLQAMRFDLCENGMFILNDIEIVVWLTNGEKKIIPIEECVHNGIDYRGSIVFLHEDPEIVWNWNDERLVDVVHISGNISQSLPRNKYITRLESLLGYKARAKKKAFSKKGLF